MSKHKDGWLAAAMTLFGSNWITLFGASLASVGALLIIGIVSTELLGLNDEPYLGIMAFMILPGVFVAGLLIIPVGAWWERRRVAKYGEGPEPLPAFPIINFNSAHVRRVGLLILILTAVNLLIISTATYQGVLFMDSVPFCGKVCHTVMQPEYSAYTRSPHSRVACVECHIGPGAPWFVRSKLSGLGQVEAVALDSYPRPIPDPVENLRPSRDTCEQCHWPERFTGDRMKIISKFGDDETNTPTKTVLLMHIGGGRSGGKGIHSWHIAKNRETRYLAVDAQRQKIARVTVVAQNGEKTEFNAPKGKYTPEELAHAQERVMDCIDCHNRPTHIFQMPEKAVNAAMEAGRIDPSIPYIKKVSVETLTDAKGAADDLEQIASKVHEYYEKNQADFYKEKKGLVDKAITELQAIYSQNVFPDMKVTWGTYTSNIGHDDTPGCFRCHDDSMTTPDGKSIGQDCTACHAVLAWDEKNPDILKQLQAQ